MALNFNVYLCFNTLSLRKGDSNHWGSREIKTIVVVLSQFSIMGGSQRWFCYIFLCKIKSISQIKCTTRQHRVNGPFSYQVFTQMLLDIKIQQQQGALTQHFIVTSSGSLCCFDWCVEVPFLFCKNFANYSCKGLPGKNGNEVSKKSQQRKSEIYHLFGDQIAKNRRRHNRGRTL